MHKVTANTEKFVQAIKKLHSQAAMKSLRLVHKWFLGFCVQNSCVYK